MELMNQPFTGQLGSRLIELLDSQDYDTLNIAVAFAKNSGVLRMKDAMERFRKRGGKVNIYVGVDLGGTSYEALTTLLLHSDSLNVVHSEKCQTFHVKIYQLLGKEKEVTVIGSHNLTGGGLWTNFESSVIIAAERSRPDVTKMEDGLDEYIEKLVSLNDSFLPIQNQGDVDRLLQNGYVLKEVSEEIRRAKYAAQNEGRERLFGNGAPAKIPRVNLSKKQDTGAVSPAPSTPASIPMSEEGQTIWFETSSMTGGSRNILDLSMKSLVTRGDPKGTSFDRGEPGFMRGGVEFFGLDPADTDQVKDITLNFEGVDYEGNTILFPVGRRANGTWRLQIKGVSLAGKKITDAFREKGTVEYLVEKLVTFTKIQEGYYFTSVYPESELGNFRGASRILAHNGVTHRARQLGVL